LRIELQKIGSETDYGANEERPYEQAFHVAYGQSPPIRIRATGKCRTYQRSQRGSRLGPLRAARIQGSRLLREYRRPKDLGVEAQLVAEVIIHCGYIRSRSRTDLPHGCLLKPAFRKHLTGRFDELLSVSSNAA
jgi:hypothetical protein